MPGPSFFKGLGYSISTLSVLLLGIVAWNGAKEKPLLFACLLAGMLASVIGMGLRWISHRLEQKEKERIEAEARGGGLPGAAPGPMGATWPENATSPSSSAACGRAPSTA